MPGQADAMRARWRRFIEANPWDMDLTQQTRVRQGGAFATQTVTQQVHCRLYVAQTGIEAVHQDAQSGDILFDSRWALAISDDGITTPLVHTPETKQTFTHPTKGNFRIIAIHTLDWQGETYGYRAMLIRVQ